LRKESVFRESRGSGKASIAARIPRKWDIVVVQESGDVEISKKRGLKYRDRGNGPPLAKKASMEGGAGERRIEDPRALSL